MKISFSKYHGTGNDFIMLDNRDGKYSTLAQKQIELLCNRRFGIGADGLILLENETAADFRMIYFNSDGKEGSMCGNGGRCTVAFANSLLIIKDETNFVAVDGMHEATIRSNHPLIVKLKMCDVSEVEFIKDDMFLNTGSPHYVKFVNDVSSVDVVAEGRAIRNNERFREKGTNANFVQPKNDELILRSYERGVEDETLSCGTGAVASALAAVTKGIVKAEGGVCKLKVLGGNLNVHFEKTENGFKNIMLEGEAAFVYKGEIEL